MPDLSYREIPLTQGQVAIVDAEDYEWLSKWKWFAQWNSNAKSYYAQRRITLPGGKRRKFWMHREIVGLKPLDGKICDHRDMNSLNNTRENLRIVSPAQNKMNQKVRKDSSTGIKGTSKSKYGIYSACITVSGKDYWLGSFPTLEQAATAYAEAVEKYHGEFGRTS